jgi:hypothetical protein
MPAPGSDVHLAAQDRLDAALLGVVVEDHRREHVPVLGDRQRGHFETRRLIEQLVNAARAIEQGILGVQMKMNEFLVSHVWEKTLL